MITIAEGQKTLARFAFGLPVLQRHFHRHFYRYGAGVREKNALQRLRRHCHQFAAQLNGGRMGDTAKHHMRHSINLRFHRRIKLRVIVTVDRRPPDDIPSTRRLPSDKISSQPSALATG